jgi:hypothetical protein
VKLKLFVSQWAMKTCEKIWHSYVDHVIVFNVNLEELNCGMTLWQTTWLGIINDFPRNGLNFIISKSKAKSKVGNVVFAN